MIATPAATLGRAGAALPWAVAGAFLAAALLAPWLAPHDPLGAVGGSMQPPLTPGHPLGTDGFGRDQLSRVLHGLRPLLVVSLGSVAVALAVGGLYGLVSGAVGGRTDWAMMRAVDVLMSFPLILAAILVLAGLGPSLLNLTLAVAVSQLPVFARLARALAAGEAARDYVTAARAAGFGPWHVMGVEILPNVARPLLVQATSVVAVAALTSAALSYLGLGTRPPTPDLGYMVKEGQELIFIAPDQGLAARRRHRGLRAGGVLLRRPAGGPRARGGPQMTAEILRRLAVLPVTMLVVATLVFLALRALPGSTVDMLSSAFASAGLREELIARLGLDEPLWRQYLTYLADLARLDLGRSFLTGRSVAQMVGETLPVTIELAVASLLVMLAFGLGAGLAAGARPGTAVDRALRLLAMTLFSLPWFWLGIVLIVVFSLWLGWLPAFGRLPSLVVYEPLTNFVLIDAMLLGRPDLIGPWLAHLTLPALTVGLTTAGMLMRLTRAGVIETSRLDFVRTARMKGVPSGRVFFRHILRNAALGILTIVGLQFGAMLGGSVVAEVVFGYPGIGRMMVDAVLARDYAVAQGAALVIAGLYVLVNLATDLAYRWADPRLRRAGGP